jgi:hypothetical protein
MNRSQPEHIIRAASAISEDDDADLVDKQVLLALAEDIPLSREERDRIIARIEADIPRVPPAGTS